MAAPRLIIGLGHRKRVGKDTFADLLDRELTSMGWRVIKHPFALRMKETAHDLFGWGMLGRQIRYELFPEDKEAVLPRLGKSPRQIWIEFGNAVRAIHPDVWVNCWKAEVDRYCSQFTDGRRIAVVIPDVRFPNEVEAIESWGGLLIKITREAAPVANDPAECALENYDGWHRTFANDETLVDLENDVSWFADYLTGKF